MIVLSAPVRLEGAEIFEKFIKKPHSSPCNFLYNMVYYSSTPMACEYYYFITHTAFGLPVVPLGICKTSALWR